MFGPIHGVTGWGVGAAQLALAIAEPGLIFRQGPLEWFGIRHCGVIVSGSMNLPPGSTWKGQVYPTGVMTAPRLVQAMPGGAEIIDLTYEKWNREYVYLRPTYGLFDGTLNFYQFSKDDQAAAVAQVAQAYVNTPYDFLTYGAIPLYRRGIRTHRVKEIISGTDTMMCSRLLDCALEGAGWFLFDDGRLPGNVTPSEAYRRLLRLPLDAISKITEKPIR